MGSKESPMKASATSQFQRPFVSSEIVGLGFKCKELNVQEKRRYKLSLVQRERTFMTSFTTALPRLSRFATPPTTDFQKGLSGSAVRAVSADASTETMDALAAAARAELNGVYISNATACSRDNVIGVFISFSAHIALLT